MPNQGQRVALVTEATSGIGLAVARLLAEQGGKVFICARSADSVTATVKQLRQQGLEVAGATCDVRRADEVRALVRAAVERYGTVDILVNNAGRGGGGATADLPDELWYDVIDTNLNSVFLVTREVLTAGGMREKAAGRIINVASASTAGRHGAPPGTAHSASIHGVVGFTKALGSELARQGITVNVVCPGYVEVPLPPQERGRGPAGGMEPDALQGFRETVPVGRFSTPEEVAGMVGYLVSDAAAAITAQTINVSGEAGPGL